MNEQGKFSINVAEIHCIEGNGGGQGEIERWYHSFLCLVDESKGAFVKGSDSYSTQNIVEQLHFSGRYASPTYLDDPVDLSIKNRLNRTTFFPMLGGYRNGIMPVWEHMLSYSESTVENCDIRFHKNARYEENGINCRTFVGAALKSIGLELYRDFTLHSAGMGAPNFFMGTQYNHGLKPPERN